MIALKRTSPLPIGLQLGPRSATLMQLAGRPGQWTVHAMAHGELHHEADASPAEQERQTAAALQKLIADHRFHGRQVVSCLGAEELFVQNVRLPQLPPDEIAKVIRWEAEERLPYPVAEAELRHLLAGQVRQDTNVKQEVILLACHRGLIDRHLSVLQQAGLTPLGIDVEPCAVLRSLRDAENGNGAPDSRRAYLNLGERSTTVIFADGDRILFLKYISSGGHHLDLAVARHLDLELAEAAAMRAGVTASSDLDPEDDIHRSVIDAVRGPLEGMAAEIEHCLRYYKVTFRGKPLESLVLTGSETSGWLAEFLEERLVTSCELGNPFAALASPPAHRTAQERPWRWTTAMGLSMKNLKE